MEAGFDRERLSKWLLQIAATEDDEIDCDALDNVLEQIVAIAASGEDIRSILPEVAVHLDHCPECSEMYETLVALSQQGSS